MMKKKVTARPMRTMVVMMNLMAKVIRRQQQPQPEPMDFNAKMILFKSSLKEKDGTTNI